MIGDRVVVHIHVVKFGIRSVSQFVSATLGLLTGPRVTDTDDSRESPLRSAPGGRQFRGDRVAKCNTFTVYKPPFPPPRNHAAAGRMHPS